MRTRLASYLCAALVACAGLWAHRAAHGATATTLALAFLPYSLLLVSHAGRKDARHALLLCALCSVWLVCAPPVLSDDVYRYLWDGQVLGKGLDPYAYPPDHPSLAPLRDAAWQRVNHSNLPTIYPPLAQLTFAALDAVWHSVHVMKAAAALVHLSLSAWLLHRWGPRACVWLALNPLALSESALNGHLDIAVGAALCLAAWQADRARHGLSSLWFALASGLKMIGLLLAPLAVPGRCKRVWLPLCLASCVLLPQFWPPRTGPGGAGHYAHRWRGNEGGFSLIERTLRETLRGLSSPAERRHGHFTLPSLRPLLEGVRDTPLDPFWASLPEKKEIPDRANLELTFLSGLLARASVGLGLLVLVTWLWARGSPSARSTRLVLLIALWFAPQVHPWYVLWVLPLECALGGITGLVWSACALAAYAPLDLWHSTRSWHESELIRALEFGVVALVFLCEPWLFKGVARDYDSPQPRKL